MVVAISHITSPHIMWSSSHTPDFNDMVCLHQLFNDDKDLDRFHNIHQENIRVIFDIFVSGNHIFEHYVFVMKVFQGLCLWIQIFDLSSEAIRSLSQKVGLSHLKVFGCEGHVFLNEIVIIISYSSATTSLNSGNTILEFSYSYACIN